jgi:hypothetical protein
VAESAPESAEVEVGADFGPGGGIGAPGGEHEALEFERIAAVMGGEHDEAQPRSEELPNFLQGLDRLPAVAAGVIGDHHHQVFGERRTGDREVEGIEREAPVMEDDPTILRADGDRWGGRRGGGGGGGGGGDGAGTRAGIAAPG